MNEGQRRNGHVYNLRHSLPLPLSVVVVAAVSKPRELSSDVMAAFIHQVSIESPSEEQRRAMLASLSEGMPLGRDVNLARLAKHTAVRSIAWF